MPSCTRSRSGLYDLADAGLAQLVRELVEMCVPPQDQGFLRVLNHPRVKCAKCGATYLSHDAVGVLELGAAGELARHGEVSAEAFGFMRRALGVRAVELAEWLDVTPETVSRWEHGRQPIDREAAAILSAMVLDRLEDRTTTLDRLITLLKPEPLPKLVRLISRTA